MNEADEEFDRARQKSQGRFRSAFEAIFEKYGKLDDKDDIIDLVTGEIIVDNGRMRDASVIELGDLLHYPDSPSASFRARGRKRRHHSPDSPRRAARRNSPSPELMSYEEQLRQALARQEADRVADIKPSNIGTDPAQDLSDTEDSDVESMDLDFASYSSILSRQHIGVNNGVRKRANRRRDSLDSNNLGYSYESSDSVGTEQETSIDTYFTSSIEHYLEKLRHQLAAQPAEYAEEIQNNSEDGREEISNSSADESDDMVSKYSSGLSRQSSNTPTHHAQQDKSMLNPYAIPSSPRTMSPFNPRDGKRSFENMPPENRLPAEEIYVSETCSQESEPFSEEESVSSVCSSESVVVVEPLLQHETPMFGLIEPTAQITYIEYSDDGDGDGDGSEEEPVQDPFISELVSGQEAFSDFSPGFLHSLDHSQTRHPQTYHPASLPPQPYSGTTNNRLQPAIPSHRPPLSAYSNHAESIFPTPGVTGNSQASHTKPENMGYNNTSTSIRGPILLKPQPVSPHVFFDFRTPPNRKRAASSAFKNTLMYSNQQSVDRKRNLDNAHYYDHDYGQE
ncbi:hypothetical protein GGF39_003770 [Coemansia sp. RSA 1721]|nr:hypothetical protein GGF39_003770 [Coemansia sp. RSA 1721]